MCTVSFIPKTQGWYLAMNRDEQRSRPPGLPPAFFHGETCLKLYPHEPEGGTWIGANDAGLCLALINWHAESRIPERAQLSRGTIIPTLLDCEELGAVHCRLEDMPLVRFQPFRLVAVSPQGPSLHFWSWNGQSLYGRGYLWSRMHWFSSGFNETEVSRVRQQTCLQAATLSGVGTIPWLRKLHASHHPEKGPYSICMHRRDATTVSYTELIATRRTILMNYFPGSPCELGKNYSEVLKLRVAQPALF